MQRNNTKPATTGDTTPPTLGNTDDGAQALALFQQLDPEAKETILAVLRAIIVGRAVLPMSLQTIHLTQGDHNAALVACQHPAATEDDKAFLANVAAMYVICERIQQDEYLHLQAILRRLDGAQPAGNLPPFFHQHPEITYRLCKLWGDANTETEWHYVAGWIDGIGNNLSADDIVETGDNLVFLHRLALTRSLMAWEVKP